MAEKLVCDTWRAILFVGCLVAACEVLREPPPPAPQMAFMPPQQWAPVGGNQYPVHENRPLRRIGSAFVELGDSVIGAIRR